MNSNPATIMNPLMPQGEIYTMILEFGQSVRREPAVLYQTPISGLRFTVIDCDIAYVGVGQSCIVSGIFTDRATTDRFYIKIEFLSSGTVSNAKPLNIQLDPTIEQYNIQALRYGGYLFTGIKTNETNYIYGNVINDNGQLFPWNLPNPTELNLGGITSLLPNNTFVIAQPEGEKNWSLITTDLIKFEEERGKVTQTRKNQFNLKIYA